MADEMRPNRASGNEKAEGSRENVNLGTGAGNPMERGSGQRSRDNEPPKADNDDAGSVPNRPLPEEEQLESELPPRGQAKKGE